MLRWSTALLLLMPPALSAPSLRPAKGIFLVARPSIESGPFQRSVVLLLYHDDRGTLGVIVNRSTEIPLSEAVPDLEPNDSGHELYFGGPVALGGLLFVFESDETPERAHEVLDNIQFSGDRELLELLIADEAPRERVSLFLGHAGWSPGQLDREILQGSWDLVPADTASVFERDRDTLWRELSKRGTLTAHTATEDSESPSTDRESKTQ